MPFSIKKVKEETRSATFEVGDQTGEVSFYPKRFTKSLLNQAAESGDNIDQLIAILVPLIASWDVVDDDGNPYPITPESLAEFPLEVLRVIQEAIFAEYLPGEGNGATS
jgi:hypothetical protein